MNTFKFGHGWDHVVDGQTEAGKTPPDGAKLLADSGLQGSNPSGLTGQGFPAISVTGYTSLSNTAGGVSQNVHTYTADDSLTRTFARHVWKSGVFFQDAINAVAPQPNYGSFAFDGSLSGNAYADFLLGAPHSSARTNPLRQPHFPRHHIGHLLRRYLQGQQENHTRVRPALGLCGDAQVG